MKPGGIRSGASVFHSSVGVALCAAAFALLLPSCGTRDRDARFADSLSHIDREIESGNGRKALAGLRRLRRDAMSSGNWLSIAKRERSLGDGRSAIATLSRGLSRIPSSADLAAVMADELIRAGNLDKARDYASSLSQTAYAPLRAWLDITVATRDNPFAADGESWKAAAAATGLAFFARNGAVSYAMNGDILRACETAMADPPAPQSDALPDEALFRATLCYDAGFYERALAFLPPENPLIRDGESLSLMADAAWSLGSLPVARELWARVALDAPGDSALARYDLAVTAPDFAGEKATLEGLLASFPAYYPAVVRYVRGVGRNSDESVFDSIEEELETSGFRSQDMERKLAGRRVSRESARKVLDAALRHTQHAVDARLLLEDIRLDWQTGGDSVKSASRVWNLLERHPDDGALRDWAMWFFASVGDLESALALNRGSKDGPRPFYSGIERALAGDLEAAEGFFELCADDATNDWRALANVARIREKRDEIAPAVDAWSLAAGMTDDDREASALHYEAARLLAELRSWERARSILGYALELDPSNYRADALLRGLEASR